MYINSEDYILGKVLPDINYFLNTFDLSRDINKGYLVYLLLDMYYLIDYIEKNYLNENVFIDNKIYQYYDYLNYSLKSRFNLNLIYLEKNY